MKNQNYTTPNDSLISTIMSIFGIDRTEKLEEIFEEKYSEDVETCIFENKTQDNRTIQLSEDYSPEIQRIINLRWMAQEGRKTISKIREVINNLPEN